MGEARLGQFEHKTGRMLGPDMTGLNAKGLKD